MKRFATAIRPLIFAAAIAVTAGSDAHAQFERIVLLEELTAVTCKPCANAGEIINTILAENPTRVTSIRYHTLFLPSPEDPFWVANKPESDARRSFYEVIGIPVVRVDGSLSPPATDENEVRARVSEELAIESPISLTVTHQPVEGGQMRVTVMATAGPEGLSTGYHLRVAALERFVHDPTFATDPYNGEIDIYDIFRDMLPNAGGEEITLDAGETKTFTYIYAVDAGWQADQMYAVAFVQDAFDKTVLQAGFSPRPTSSVESPDIAGYGANAASPNPATDHARIDYTLGRPGRLDARLYDATGALVRAIEGGMHDAGRGTVTLDLEGLPAGVYNCVMSSGAWSWSDRVVVTR